MSSTRSHSACSLLLASLFLLGCQAFPQITAADEPPPTDSAFLRIRRSADGRPVALETAIVRYVSADGSSVDLIGAVHIGDLSYYEQLNEILPSYDVLLYELVAPENLRPDSANHKSQHPVTGLQRSLKSLLDLEFQLDRVDYSPSNFVHADMSPGEFAQSMKDRGESFFQIYFRVLGHALATQTKQPPGTSDASLLLALFSKNRALRLKQIMAEQFEDLEGAMSAFGGPDGSTLITERNKKALEVLKRQLEEGKRRVGIFYGAGHFPDMQQKLLDQFQLQRSETRWLTAWDLQQPSGKNVQP